RRECEEGEQTRVRGVRRGRAWGRGGRGGGEHDVGDFGVLEEDRRHHRGDRRDRVPDQHPGAERGGGGGARGRAGARVRRGGIRGEEPGAALGGGGQGDPATDLGLGGAHRRGLQTGGRGGQDDGGDRGVREAGEWADRG